MTKYKIYVASPYSIGNRKENVKRSILACEQLWALGLVPYCPLLSHYWDKIAPHTWEDWMRFDLEWLSVCDGVYWLYGESKGAEREVDFADNAWIPVFIETTPGSIGGIKDMVEYFHELDRCQ
jgi:hypothetical protein